MRDAITASDEGALLRIKVTPKARKPGILGLRGEALAVAVGAAPERGKATEEALRLLAESLGVPRARLRLKAGVASRDKRVLVLGYTASDLRKWLEGVGGGPPSATG